MVIQRGIPFHAREYDVDLPCWNIARACFQLKGMRKKSYSPLCDVKVVFLRSVVVISTFLYPLLQSSAVMTVALPSESMH